MRNIISDLYLHYLLISHFAYDGIGIEPLHHLIHVDDKVFARVYLFFQRRNGFIAEQLARTYVRYAIAAAFGGRTDIDTEKQSATFYQHIDQSVLVKAEVAAVRAESIELTDASCTMILPVLMRSAFDGIIIPPG